MSFSFGSKIDKRVGFWIVVEGKFDKSHVWNVVAPVVLDVLNEDSQKLLGKLFDVHKRLNIGQKFQWMIKEKHTQDNHHVQAVAGEAGVK